jgi:hypothetical protein
VISALPVLYTNLFNLFLPGTRWSSLSGIVPLNCSWEPNITQRRLIAGLWAVSWQSSPACDRYSKARKPNLIPRRMCRSRGINCSRFSKSSGLQKVRKFPRPVRKITEIYYLEQDWPGLVDMPEYQNMKRLDQFVIFLPW